MRNIEGPKMKLIKIIMIFMLLFMQTYAGWFLQKTAEDSSGNKWFGTRECLAVFKEGGIVTEKGIKKSVSKTGYNIVLHQTYPITRISYSVSNPDNIVLSLFDIKGRRIKSLINEFKKAGNYSIEFSISNLAKGTYFICLRTGTNGMITRKIVVFR